MAFLVYLDDTRTNGRRSYGPLSIPPERMRVLMDAMNGTGIVLYERPSGGNGYADDTARLADILLKSDATVKSKARVGRKQMTHVRMADGYKVSSCMMTYIV